MKISENIDLSQLEKYGFEPYNEDNKDCYSEYLEYCKVAYILSLGHSRRGQYYYFLVSENRILSLYASKPDGDGGLLEIPQEAIDCIYSMQRDRILIP